MKHIVINAVKQAMADRKVLFFCIAILAIGLVYIGYVALSLHASDLQLATRYTSFGETHFYRNKWYYLLSFILFGALYTVMHIGIIVKLYVSEMKPLATTFGWLSILMGILLFSYTYHVLSIAYLS